MKFIVTADTHLRDDQPRCRTDKDWLETQRKMLNQIFGITLLKRCQLLIVGDIFHWSTVSEQLKTMLLKVIQEVESVYILAGNHDIQYGNFKNVYRSSFGLFWSMIGHSNIKALHEIGKAAHYGEEVSGTKTGLMFLHQLVFESEQDMPPNVKAVTAQQLLNDYPDAQWIFCGDNHHGFVYKSKDARYVIVPGCTIRQRSNFIDYKPRVYYVDTDKGIVEPIYLEDDAELVSDEHVRRDEERDENVTAFIESIKDVGEVSLDYLQNVGDAMAINTSIGNDVKAIIAELIDEVRT